MARLFAKFVGVDASRSTDGPLGGRLSADELDRAPIVILVTNQTSVAFPLEADDFPYYTDDWEFPGEI